MHCLHTAHSIAHRLVHLPLLWELCLVHCWPRWDPCRPLPTQVSPSGDAYPLLPTASSPLPTHFQPTTTPSPLTGPPRHAVLAGIAALPTNLRTLKHAKPLTHITTYLLFHRLIIHHHLPSPPFIHCIIAHSIAHRKEYKDMNSLGVT